MGLQMSHLNPMLSVSLPKDFLEANPHAAEALAINTHRMVTVYDIYATMRQIGAAGGTLASPLQEMQMPYMPAKVGLFDP